MLALFRKFISKARRKFFTYSLIAILLEWMLISFYPSVQKEAADFSKLIESYPEGLMKAFGVEGDFFSSFSAFISGEHFSLMWPLLAILFAVTLGANLIAGEIDDNTIDTLMSQPMSRIKFYIVKYLAYSVVLFGFVFVSIMAIYPLAGIYGVSVNLTSLFKLFAVGCLFVQSIFGLSSLLSSLLSNRGNTLALAGGIVLFMYALQLVSALQDSVKDLKYLSYFYYFDYKAALVDGQIMVSSLVVFGTSITLTLLLGLLTFNRRDINV